MATRWIWRRGRGWAALLGALLLAGGALAPGRAWACSPFEECPIPPGGATVVTTRPVTGAGGTIVGPSVVVANERVLVTIVGPRTFPVDPIVPMLPPNPVIVLLPR